MLRGEERKSDRNRRGKVFRTQGTTATASLCRNGGEDGVREKKKRVGDDCNTQWLCKRLGANMVYSGRCASGNKFINFSFSGSLRGLKNLVLSTDSQLSIRPSLGIREEERGGQGTFTVSPFCSLLLQILILGWSTVSQSPYGGQSTRFELHSPSNATPQFLFRY